MIILSRYAELRNKEIINVSDGSRMGYVCDVEFDLETGKLNALIVPRKTGFWGIFTRQEDYVISWKDIKKIGDDIIFVEFCL